MTNPYPHLAPGDLFQTQDPGAAMYVLKPKVCHLTALELWAENKKEAIIQVGRVYKASMPMVFLEAAVVDPLDKTLYPIIVKALHPDHGFVVLPLQRGREELNLVASKEAA